MFNAEVVDGDNKVCKYLGLYGMGGVGKTTLCKALCSYFQGEFCGRVCHVELTSDQGHERLASAERLACLKRVVQQLAAFEKSVPQGISSEEQVLSSLWMYAHIVKSSNQNFCSLKELTNTIL
jgi:ABC-type dipeptide/oligopeptide/nickel transport system ATPase subunit